MIKKITLILILFVGSMSFVQAQQTVEPAQYTMYMLNKYQFNPAYAGLDDALRITGVFRKQWVKLEGSPSQQHVGLHLPFEYIRGGLGLKLENDVIGAERNTLVAASYNFYKPMNFGLLTFGLEGGFIQKTLDGTKLGAPDGDYSPDFPINHNDDFIPLGSESAGSPTFGAGIYLKTERFELGLSGVNLLESSANFNFGEKPQIKLKRNYFLNFAYNLDISSDLSLQPNLLIKSDAVELQTDLSIILNYNDNIFAGLSFRGYSSSSFDSGALIAGFKMNEKFTLAYSYDLTISALNTVSNGSHEIMINYNLNTNFGKGIPEKVIFSPRFL